jgi:hypothetical protein
MARLDETFVAEDHPDEFELLPAGVYLLQVTESEIADNKAGTGKILKITLEIVEGEFAGRFLWERLNIRHPTPQAQAIALKQLAKLANAVGVPNFDDTEELHYKPVIARVGIRKDKSGEYRDQNVIQGYEAVGTPSAVANAPAQSEAPKAQPEPQQQASTPTGGGAPWRKKKAA